MKEAFQDVDSHDRGACREICDLDIVKNQWTVHQNIATRTYASFPETAFHWLRDVKLYRSAQDMPFRIGRFSNVIAG